MLEEKVNELVSEFWTRKNEMEESVESVGLYVASITARAFILKLFAVKCLAKERSFMAACSM